MAARITQEQSFTTYATDAGFNPSYKINKAIDCGLAGIWLYLKSIGLEETYFEILNKSKTKSIFFKDIFYLLMLTNTNNNFFSKIPSNILDTQIPTDFAQALINVAPAEFAIAYAFTTEELTELLKEICLPNKMVRLGNMQTSLGIMQGTDKKYYIYHPNNSEALCFTNIKDCVNKILRDIPLEDKRLALFINRSDLEQRPVAAAPDITQLLQKYNKNAPVAAKHKALEFAVRANLVAQAQFWCEQCMPLDKSYKGPDLLALAVVKKNAEMIKLLLSHPSVQRNDAIDMANKSQDQNIISLFREITNSPAFLPSTAPKKR